MSVKPKSPGIAPAIQHDHKAGNFDGRCSWVGSVDNFFIMLIFAPSEASTLLRKDQSTLNNRSFNFYSNGY